MKVNTDQAIQIAKVAGGLIVIGVAARIAKSFFGNDIPPKIDSEIATNNAAQIASMLKNAIGEWYNNSDEKAILRIAGMIKDYQSVQNAYYQMTKRSLTSDLQSVLDADEYAEFISILNKNRLTRLAFAANPAPNIFNKNRNEQAIVAFMNTPTYAMPSTIAKVLGYTRTPGANLGPILKRINNAEGNWYLVNSDGMNVFVRESDLI